MPIPLRKSSTLLKDRQFSSIGGIRESSVTARKLRPVPRNNELSQERRGKRVTPTPSPGDNETVAGEKQNAGRASLLPQRRDVKSKISGTEVVAGDMRMAIDQSTVIEKDESRKTNAEPTSSFAVSLRGSTSYPGEVFKTAPRAVASSSAAASKTMGPPKALGRSHSVRRSDVVGNSAMNISQGHRPRASVNTNPQASARAAHAPYRRNLSLTKPDAQPPLRSVLGQASAAANQHRRSVSNVSESGAQVMQDRSCSSGKTSNDAKQKFTTSSTQRASSANSGSVRLKSPHMPKDEDGHSKHQTRISSAPTGQPAKLRRGEFTTLQQHFTPKKNSKPLTASYIVRSPYKQSGADVLSPETITLQTELLQMHVLHRSSYTVQSQWERSAERGFRQRFENLVGHYAGIRAKEHDAQERLNLLALTGWCQDHSNLQLAEKAQVLSHTIQNVQTMTDPGGRYTRIVAVFEQWFAWSSRLLQSREEGQIAAEQEVEFVEDLGDGWRAELAVLERKLASMTREFSRLGPARDGSSLLFILTSLGEMIIAMQEEIASMRIIETQILTQEQAWVAGLIDELTSDISSDLILSETFLRKGVWEEVG